MKWFDAERRQAIHEKNAARQKWLTARKTRGSDAIHKAYKDERRRAVYLCRKRKRHFEDTQMRKVELLSGRSDTRKFSQTVKRLKEGYSPPTIFCIDSNGNMLVNDEDVLRRWREYFAELLASSDSSSIATPPPSIPLEDLEEASLPSIAEIRNAINKLKRNKSPGSDGIHAELFKSAGDILAKYLYELFSRIWTAFTMPSEWSLSMITPVYKKGDKKECQNYRGISVQHMLGDHYA